MIEHGIHAFRGKRVLLLQGPVGPFFARLARDLKSADATVFKVNFNAGDWLFYPRNAINFDRPMQEWPAFLDELLTTLNIEVVLLFGDCRQLHREAHRIACERGLEVGVFEEGYIRPDYITLERFGVNGHSQLPRNPVYYLNKTALPELPRRSLPSAYWHMVLWGFLYFAAGALGAVRFPHYRHHRPMHSGEALPWVRSFFRRGWFAWRERKAMPQLTGEWSGRFFLVPLQVHNDAQIFVHSPFNNVESFITEVMRSFASRGPGNVALVFKHHPMDRGYTHYGALISRLAAELGIADRCFYVHDLHMPTLLRHTRGVVVINSTTGLQALQKGVPVKALGEAIFNMPGLCYQGRLVSFWHRAAQAAPDARLLQQFVRYLILRTQLNASFYRADEVPGSAAGVHWTVRDWPVHDAPVAHKAVSAPLPRHLSAVNEPEDMTA